MSLWGWKLPRHLPDHEWLPLTAKPRHRYGLILKDLRSLMSEGLSAAVFHGGDWP